MKKLPAIYVLLTKTILDWEEREYFLGDLEEIYLSKIENGGILISNLWLMFHFLISVPPIIIDNIIWSIEMIKNFVKIAFRNIFKHKAYSILNISGLAIGMACSIMIMLYVLNERSYDKYNKDANQIYRIAVNANIGGTKIGQTYTPAILTPTLLTNYPEVENSIRFQNASRGLPVTYNNKTFTETNFTMVDPQVFEVFTIPFVFGDSSTALAEPNTVVISQSIAKKYFGTSDPMGKTMDINGSECKVTGIVKDLPENSHFHFNIFVSLTTTDQYKTEHWFNNNWKTYIKLKEGVSKEEFNLKLMEIVKKYTYGGEENYKNNIAGGNFWEYYLQPLTDIHLHSDLNGEFEQNGNAEYVSMFFVIAILIILIASFNYMNLATARLSGRAKEVGIRKVVGSSRSMLIKQFLLESISTSLISLVISLILVQLFIPLFSDLIGVYTLQIPYYENLWYLLFLIGFAILVGLLSGSYPSFYLSSIESISALSGSRKTGGKWFRDGLVLVQFAMSIFLFIGTLIVREQLAYTQNKKLGFTKEEVLVLKGASMLGDKLDVFKDLLEERSDVKSVSSAIYLPGMGFSNYGIGVEGRDKGITLNLLIGDYGYLETLDLEMAEGRFYSKDFSSDSSAIIINETAAKLIGWDEPLNKNLFTYADGRNYKIIGVVKDFHYESLHQTIRPAAIVLKAGEFDWGERYIAAKINTKNLSSTIAYVQSKWEEFAPNMPFEYTFLDDEYAGLYNNEKRTSDLASTFSFLAIFIACIGLFGLISFVAELKTKEIGIRKVMGASVPNLVFLISKEFAVWVIGANLIAWPIGYWLMEQWLQNYAYRIEISWMVFVLSGFLALFIALITVSYQSIKSALANPVDSIRYE